MERGWGVGVNPEDKAGRGEDYEVKKTEGRSKIKL